MHIAVTGAFGYSGRYIAQRLLEAGHSVITLTRHYTSEMARRLDRVSGYRSN